MTTEATLVDCPNCKQSVDVAQHEETVSCPMCAHQFKLSGHLCPDCFYYYGQETAVCSRCGGTIKQICQQCQAVNWAGDEQCRTCGANLDILEMMQGYSSQAERERLQKLMDNAPSIKAKEQEAAEKRMAKLMEIEEQRQIELARRQAQQKKQERFLLLTAIAISLLFMASLIAWALLS